ncbi:hypothetical protein ABIF69_000536 [Bradyrhizobium japonicum]
MDIIEAIVTKSQWIIAILALFVVAWARFNSPPTNRSGTTFALFFWGVIFYYALMIPLWLVVMIGLVQGSIGFDFIVGQVKAVDPKAQAQLAQYAPIVAVLIIVSLRNSGRWHGSTGPRAHFVSDWPPFRVKPTDSHLNSRKPRVSSRATTFEAR